MYRVLHKTDQLLVIDKSAGTSFHSEQGEAGLAEQLKQDLGGGSLYPVHRLDRMTSGLLLFARDLDSAQQLNEQFRQRRVEKFYLALSDRKPKKKQGLVCGDMVKARRGSWRLLKSRNNPAWTRFVSCSAEPGLRLFLLKPLTGRTHQLRVAMKSLGAPIIGDRRYGQVCEAEQDRGYLHAFALRFVLRDEPYQFICPPTEGELFARETVRRALTAWRDPWSLEWPADIGCSDSQ